MERFDLSFPSKCFLFESSWWTGFQLQLLLCIRVIRIILQFIQSIQVIFHDKRYRMISFKFSCEIHFRIFQFLIRSLRIDLLAFIFEYFPDLLQIFKQLEGLNSDDIFRGNGGNGGKQKTSRDKKQWRVISITTLIKIQMKSLKALRAG